MIGEYKEEILNKYREYLKNEGYSVSTIENILRYIDKFLDWYEQQKIEFLNCPLVTELRLLQEAIKELTVAIEKLSKSQQQEVEEPKEDIENYEEEDEEDDYYDDDDDYYDDDDYDDYDEDEEDYEDEENEENEEDNEPYIWKA